MAASKMLGLALALAVLPGLAPAKERAEYARELRHELASRILPYWYDSAIDRTNGGYVLSDDAAQPARPAREKQLVTQARMIWGFSHAHRKGFSDGRHNYLQAAAQGYRFLVAHFLDRENGGYFWTTDLRGKALNRNKIVYGEAFVIYGLVEYFRASGDRTALERAMELYRVLQEHAHDARNGGWIEHFQPDWTPLAKHSPEAIVEVAGYKSGNTHLHLMEALSELYEATRDPAVKQSLEEALRLNATYFYPQAVGQSCFHRQADWKPVTDAASAGVSYGHNVEFAWLMVRAQRVLGQAPAWDHFGAELDHALKYGYDHARGGLYSRGFDERPATVTEKVWWVQGEMLAALTEALQHQEKKDYAAALNSLLRFVLRYQANPADGIWLDTVAADGKPIRTAKAHNWKANYHDVRAMVKFIEANGGGLPSVSH